MTVTFHCGDNEALVGYMYDEGEPGERAAIAAHVATCASCAGELAALGATREGLAAWTPPDVPLGFRIVSEPPANVVPLARRSAGREGGWWQRPMPAWAQAAAAAMIFAAGLGLGALRGGSVEPASAVATTAAPATAGAAATTVSPQDLRALEQRLLAEVAQARPAPGSVAPATAPQVAGTATLTMQQVQALIAESEQRQQRELTLRTAEVIRDFDTQRRGDLARIQQTFGRLEGTTGAEAEQQRQMLNYLMRVSQRPQ
jgi:hypothetical protein